MSVVWLELGQLASLYCPLCLGCYFVIFFFLKCEKSVYSCITNVALVGTKVNFHCDFTTQFDTKKNCNLYRQSFQKYHLKFMKTLKLISWSKWD